MFSNRHKISLVLLGLTLALSVLTSAENDCKCWQGYQPHQTKEGSTICRGVMFLTELPCNIPEPPECKCSKNVTGIVTDATGTYCSTYSKGKEMERWSCENKEDWDRYKQETAKV